MNEEIPKSISILIFKILISLSILLCSWSNYLELKVFMKMNKRKTFFDQTKCSKNILFLHKNKNSKKADFVEGIWEEYVLEEVRLGWVTSNPVLSNFGFFLELIIFELYYFKHIKGRSFSAFRVFCLIRVVGFSGVFSSNCHTFYPSNHFFFFKSCSFNFLISSFFTFTHPLFDFFFSH